MGRMRQRGRASRSTLAAVGERDQRTRAWAEIDLEALVRNYRMLRSCAGGRRVIAVVKANAYGHGAVPVTRALAAAGCDAFAVITMDEARELREAGIARPILLLGGLLASPEADEAAELDLVSVVSRLDQIEWLEAAAVRTGRRICVHLKVDTGMCRLGFPMEGLDEALVRIGRARGLALDGLMSHLAEADCINARATARQRERFAEALARVHAGGFDPAWIHLDNSPSVLHGPTPGTTAVRPGLALYGADPTDEGGHDLAPVMALVARVCHARNVPAGTPVGYDGAYRTPAATRILTISIGYADGLPRAAGGRFCASLHGRRVPLVGRVSCDLSMIDAGAGRGEVGDEVLLFGRRGEDGVDVRELAETVGTIAYEILVGIGQRIPRICRAAAAPAAGA